MPLIISQTSQPLALPRYHRCHRCSRCRRCRRHRRRRRCRRRRRRRRRRSEDAVKDAREKLTDFLQKRERAGDW